MTRRPSRLAIVAAIVGKDLRTFARDRLWIVLTPVSLAFVAVAFWISPAEVDDALWLGVYPPTSTELLMAIGSDDGEEGDVVLVPFDDEERLVAAIAGDLEDPSDREEKVAMGLAFSDDFRAAIEGGRRTSVKLYVDPAVPPELRQALSAEVREIAFLSKAIYAGEPISSALPVRLPEPAEMILGEDRAGRQVPLRDKLRPMLAILILLLSSIAIAGLVAGEIELRTATALLVTPATAGDVLAAKGITGTLLGVSQAALFLLLTLGFGDHLWLVAILMLIGAMMTSAIGMIAGTAGRDFMTTMFLAIALLIPLAIPAFTILLPGSTSLWVQALPSYGFVEAMVGLMGYGRTPDEVTGHVLLAAAWTVVLFALALWRLKRRVEAL